MDNTAEMVAEKRNGEQTGQKGNGHHRYACNNDSCTRRISKTDMQAIRSNVSVTTDGELTADSVRTRQ